MASAASPCCHLLRQVVRTGQLWHPHPLAWIWPTGVAEIQVSAERRARIARDVKGPYGELLIFHRTPQPLDEYVVPPHAPRPSMLVAIFCSSSSPANAALAN